MKKLTFILLAILCCFGWITNTGNNTLAITKKLSNSEIEIYQNCLDSILVSDVFRYLSSDKKKILKVSSSFSRSCLINFSEKINFKSKEEVKVFSKLIDDQNYIDPNPKLAKIGRDKYSNFLVEFSKPNDRYITAFITEILYKQGSKDFLNEQIHGFMVFFLEDRKIIDHHHNAVIYEIY